MAAAKGTRAASSSEKFDYLIVGAGTAGCVLANRLSGDLTTRVGLIEAGIGWSYTSVPQRQLNNRSIPLPPGRVLDDCSSISGMAYFRGHPRDFDEWAQAGATGWSYEEVLPYFRRAENNQTWPESRYHGSGVPMNALDIANPNALVRRFLEATSSLGFAHCKDFNGPDPEGFGCRQAMIRDGRREAMVTAYVDPAAHRENLAIFTEAMVTSLVIENRRARGVVIERDGTRIQLSAARDVILCAGTYGSPQLLLLSGIGAGAALLAAVCAASAWASEGTVLDPSPTAAACPCISTKIRPARATVEKAMAMRGSVFMASTCVDCCGFNSALPTTDNDRACRCGFDKNILSKFPC